MAADHAPASIPTRATPGALHAANPVVVESAAPARRQHDCGLRPAQEQFIRLWGQMGSHWGVPRTMAETHALLYILGVPLNTDDIITHLKISRGNASMTLRALVDWGLIHRHHVPGDRKEYYVAEQDVARLFRIVLRERKRREIDPLIEALNGCRESDPADQTKGDDEPANMHNERLDNLLQLLELLDEISRRFTDAHWPAIEEALTLLANPDQ